MTVTLLESSRAKRLKAATVQAHDALDTRIMAAAPFASRERYLRFLAMQHGFHHDIAALYRNPALAGVVPDLAGRARLGAIEADFADLGAVPPPVAPPLFGLDVDLPTAFGWLYVAEGSNLGAAFLAKEARALGLSDQFGARHLAGHPDGRALHWRGFTAALDLLALDDAGEGRVIAGAVAAFGRVHGLVDRVFDA
ncbi:biliverdin-producing heme oxygenase [Sphingomonas sp. dw_22]|uniref:biliverdin-producing heme oxygenase n=1 Tax=Sphingomonas sp. dw_22 TaxID=2721175 RepID=UPI001BD35D53|nr:biliverdin-producing heme oxygenase [Sphingomonas sp. dw_22]